jgi:phage portal protein BeeE
MGIAAIFDSVDQKAAGFRIAAEKAIASGGGGGSSPYGMASSTPSLFGGDDREISDAERQYKAAKTGWTYTAIRPLAVKVADQSIKVGAKAVKPAAGRMRTKEAADLQYLTTKTLALAPQFARKDLAEGLDIIDDHPLHDAIENPNPEMCGWSLMYCTAFSIQATGRAFWWIDDQRATEGGTLRLWYLPSTWVKRHRDKPDTHWWVQVPGKSEETGVPVPRDMMCYFPYPDPADPTKTYSSVQGQAPAINLDREIEKSHTASMQNGVRPGVILHAGRLDPMPGTTGQGPRPVLTTEQRKQLLESVRLASAGVMHNGEPFIIDGMIENVTPWTRGPNDLDFPGGTKLTKERIMQGIGTNPIVAGQIEGANRASSVEAARNFYDLAVNPVITLISQVITKALAPLFADAKSASRKVYFWLEKAVAHDEELKIQKMQAGINAKAVKVDEVREWLDLKPLGGKDGEAFAGPPEPPPPMPGGTTKPQKPSRPPGGGSGKSQKRSLTKT